MMIPVAILLPTLVSTSMTIIMEAINTGAGIPLKIGESTSLNNVFTPVSSAVSALAIGIIAIHIIMIGQLTPVVATSQKSRIGLFFHLTIIARHRTKANHPACVILFKKAITGHSAGNKVVAVSYTHLDVYKRQTMVSVRIFYIIRPESIAVIRRSWKGRLGNC